MRCGGRSGFVRNAIFHPVLGAGIVRRPQADRQPLRAFVGPIRNSRLHQDLRENPKEVGESTAPRAPQGGLKPVQVTLDLMTLPAVSLALQRLPEVVPRQFQFAEAEMRAAAQRVGQGPAAGGDLAARRADHGTQGLRSSAREVMPRQQRAQPGVERTSVLPLRVVLRVARLGRVRAIGSA